jgi:hypothetical protein
MGIALYLRTVRHFPKKWLPTIARKYLADGIGSGVSVGRHTMRIGLALLIVTLMVRFGFSQAVGQSCTGLCILQLPAGACPGNGTTSITGTVYAPNGTDPLPNVTVYIPNAPVDPFTPGVSCPVVGAPPSGSPLLGTITDVNGNFTLINVPVGTNIPLVIVSGRWRRQLVIPGTTACSNTTLAQSAAVMPQNQTQGDIPKIAIATGSADPVECVLLKMGLSQSEFTDPTGTGRINLFGGGGAAGSGVIIDSGTPTQASLMANASTLNSYDVLMLPCEGAAYLKPAQELANLISFADNGGRVYTSHFGYTWMYQNPPFSGVAAWTGKTTDLSDGLATVNNGFTAGQTLQAWLQNIGATSIPGQMPVQTLREDQTGVNAPTQTWLTLNSPSVAMQFVWDTPIAAANSTVNQCGRVLFNEYHVENQAFSSFANELNQCSPSVSMTPQEKLLEYMLFELTSEGGQPSLAPLNEDFGSQAIGFTSPAQTFTWTNNSSFAAQVSATSIVGKDFSIASNNCSAVAPGTSCQITVVFTPSVLGPETATLNVQSSGDTLTASLTGTGTPGFSLSGTSLAYGSLDVGASASQTLTLTSLASGPLPVPPFVTNGQYSVSSTACGNTIAAGANCLISVTFLPTATGPQAGTLGVSSNSLLYNGLTAGLTGNGIDFTLTLSPTTGSVVAGDSATVTATLMPLAGFAAPISMSCVVATAATASSCKLATSSQVPPATSTITLTTTSQYTVVGYGGFGGHGYFWLFALGSGWLLWRSRKSASTVMRSGLLLVVFAAFSLSVTGCSGKLPAQNSTYTGPGSYTVTVSGTDGFLVHSATYTLVVTAK